MQVWDHLHLSRNTSAKPDKIVHLGAKMIYVYKDMKIVFVDEKVSDVQ